MVNWRGACVYIRNAKPYHHACVCVESYPAEREREIDTNARESGLININLIIPTRASAIGLFAEGSQWLLRRVSVARKHNYTVARRFRSHRRPLHRYYARRGGVITQIGG